MTLPTHVEFDLKNPVFTREGDIDLSIDFRQESVIEKEEGGNTYESNSRKRSEVKEELVKEVRGEEEEEEVGFMETMQRALEHFQEEVRIEGVLGKEPDNTSSNLDESVMNAYREVVPKS